MKYILKSIGLLIGLVLLWNLILLIPDFADGDWTKFGENGNAFLVIFGLVPIVILILLDLDKIDIYALPFSGTFEYGVPGIMFISTAITSITCSCFDSSLGNAFSFILTIFILFYPIHLFYKKLIRNKVKNQFIKDNLFAIIVGGLMVVSIVLSYILACFDTYLPGDMLLSLGETSIIDGLVTIPTLYIYPFIGAVLYVVYLFIESAGLAIINKFRPKKQYKYATYESPRESNTNTDEPTKYRGVKCCKYCRHSGIVRMPDGQTPFTCKLHGVPTSDYQSCDYFTP